MKQVIKQAIRQANAVKPKKANFLVYCDRPTLDAIDRIAQRAQKSRSRFIKEVLEQLVIEDKVQRRAK